MTDSNEKDALRQMLAGFGVELDDEKLERLGAIRAQGGSVSEQMQAVFEVLGLPKLDPSLFDSLAEMSADAETGEELADSVFIGPCPSCGFEKTRNCGEEPGIEDLTVGLCPRCGWLWCSECGQKLAREQPSCDNPECFLNGPDTDELDEPAAD